MIREVSVSAQVRKRREQLGLSLSALARRADTSAATLSRYEHGWTRFEMGTLRKLASALGCALRVELVPQKQRTSETRSGAGFRKLGRLFWDRKLSAGDLNGYPVWVVERVLDFGELEDVHALIAMMGRSRFLGVVAEAGRISPKTRALWDAILEKEWNPCMKKSSRNTAWNG